MAIALLLILLLIQALPVEALAATGRVLTDEALDRAYALTGLAKGDGQYHDGMTPNDSMSGMQLVRWLKDRLDTQLHNIDDVLSRPLPVGRAEGEVSHHLQGVYGKPVLQPGADDDASGGGAAPGHELPAGAP